MPLYGYEAVDNKGRTLKGAIEADNEQLVLAKLHEQGLINVDGDVMSTV